MTSPSVNHDTVTRPSSQPDDDSKVSGISTDLVPTLLDMYDALYARLSEDPDATATQEKLSTATSIKEEEEAAIPENPAKDIVNNNPINNDYRASSVSVSSTNTISTFSTCISSDTQCQGSNAFEKELTPCSIYDNVPRENVSLSGRRLKREHIYAEPMFSDPRNLSVCNPSIDIANENITLPCHSSVSSLSNSPAVSTCSSSPKLPLGPPFRPLSSISSSSSSSSNSLPRRQVLPTSYLASAESLEENDQSDTEETARRRGDRSIKSRREKALRTGSGDSGVQCHSISLPTPPLLRPRYCQPDLLYMDRVVLEIIETEAVYVRDLHEVIQGYLMHWREEPSSGISFENAEDLFSNIEQIYQFNSGFLDELEACGEDPVEVARCFVRNNGGFSIYTQYCTSYPRTVSVLTELMREEASVKAFRDCQLALGHTLPLGSYLLKPVQRILKYHLLLGNIVKNFDKEDPGYPEIWNALSAMTGMAHHINHMKRRHEHAVRVQEIQSLLYDWQGDDLTTYGELVAEGTFRMCGAKGLRHVFLFDRMILVTKKKEENILVYKFDIMCSNLMLIESVPGEPLCFHIIPFDNPKMQYTLEARNLEQKREWTLQLKRVILENYSAAIPAHARQLVMELGSSKQDGNLSETKSGGKRHHAPQYLERRKDRRRASEGTLHTRLKLRRSSRATKEKREKESRSRSASRNRETEEEDNQRKDSFINIEKPKLKLSMWRRRSEPGVGSRESLGSNPSNHDGPEWNRNADTTTTNDVTDHWQSHNNTNDSENTTTATTTAATTTTTTTTTTANTWRRDSLPTDVSSNIWDSMNDDINTNWNKVNSCDVTSGCSSIIQSEEIDSCNIDKHLSDICLTSQPQQSASECENDGDVDGENLEKVVSQMLQYNLKLQQRLSQKRRNILHKKKKRIPGINYETSDTENDELDYNNSRLVNNDIILSNNDVHKTYQNSSNDDYIEFNFGPLPNSEASSCWSSDAPSIGSSTISVNQIDPLSRQSKNCNYSILSQKKPSRNVSNYDNVSTKRNSMKGKSTEKQFHGNSDQIPDKDSPPKPPIRRSRSFTLESIQDELEQSSDSKSSTLNNKHAYTLLEFNKKTENVWVKDEAKERPVTIAAESIGAYQAYLQHGNNLKNVRNFKLDNGGNFSENSITPHMSLDNLVSVHPEHKIYSRLPANKNTLKNVFNKKTSHINKAVSEPSGSIYNYSMDSDLDKSLDKTASKLVYSMARHCSKTLLEKIKQIKSEDAEKCSIKPRHATEPIYAVPMYKQGSSNIGARLASEPCNYAVPRIKCDSRPDSLLSTSSYISSFPSQNNIEKTRSGDIPTDINDLLLSVDLDESPNSFESDLSADSYYERSFEAIENLENEMFRDSAIYSDHDDPDVYLPRITTTDSSDYMLSVPDITIGSSSSYSSTHSTKSQINCKSKSLERNYSLLQKTNCANVLSPIICDNLNQIISSSDNYLPINGKKVPPPVPAKPDTVKLKGSPRVGNNVMAQLRSLEQCMKSPRDDLNNINTQRLKCLDKIKNEFDICQDLSVKDKNVCSKLTVSGKSISPIMTPTPIVKCPINLLSTNAFKKSITSNRSSSVPPYLSPRQQLRNISTPSDAIHLNISHKSKGNSGGFGSDPDCIEPRMARGWVKHVIGKLQQGDNDV